MIWHPISVMTCPMRRILHQKTGTRLTNTMPEDVEAADVAAIVGRIASNTFPLVQPSEQTGVKKTSAAESLSWAKNVKLWSCKVMSMKCGADIARLL